MPFFPSRHRRPILARFAFAALAVLAIAGPVGAAPLKTAIFPFELIDSGEGTPGAPSHEAELRRLAMIASILKERLAASGVYAPIDLAGTEAAIAKSPALNGCQRCAEEIARGAGAEIAVVGYVQKVSNLILNINIRVSNAHTGQILATASADIRGNTDETWTHGIEWLVKNRLLAKPQP